MALTLRCPGCATEVDVRRRHRGAELPCPGPRCAERIVVPAEFDSRARVRGVVEDRRKADGLTLLALGSCAFWIPVVPAFAWFLATRRIAAARREDRKVALELLTARTTALTALCVQLAWYGLRYANDRYGAGFPLFLG